MKHPVKIAVWFFAWPFYAGIYSMMAVLVGVIYFSASAAATWDWARQRCEKDPEAWDPWHDFFREYWP